MTILACAVCAGDPDSPLTKGAYWGILSLIAIIIFVMGGFGSLFLFWMRRARELERELARRAALPAAGDEPSVDEAPVWRTEEPETRPADSHGPTFH